MLKALLAKGGDGSAPAPPEQKYDSSSFPGTASIPEDAPTPDDSAALALEIDSRLKLHRGGSLAGSLPTRYTNSVSCKGLVPPAAAAARLACPPARTGPRGPLPAAARLLMCCCSPVQCGRCVSWLCKRLAGCRPALAPRRRCPRLPALNRNGSHNNSSAAALHPITQPPG